MKPKSRLKSKENDSHGYNRNGYDKYSDDSEEDILPMRKVYKPQHFVEAEIKDGDTLQAIALRFNCTVATIMRTNNILRENEIFAKRVIKIPVTAYSLLTESLPLVHTSGNSSPTRNTDIKQPEPTDAQLQQKLIVASVNASQIKIPKLLQDDNLPSTSQCNASSSHLLLNHNSHPNGQATPLLIDRKDTPETVETVLVNEFTSRGEDFGIKWMHLLVCILVLAFIIPLVYIVYIAEHPEKYHHYMDHH